MPAFHFERNFGERFVRGLRNMGSVTSSIGHRPSGVASSGNNIHFNGGRCGDSGGFLAVGAIPVSGIECCARPIQTSFMARKADQTVILILADIPLDQ